MKLLFFRTAALMTVAYASKAAIQQSAGYLSYAPSENCNWVQESSNACDASNVPEIVNVYNYYEYRGC
jgi:hypothetical protein